MKTEKSIRLVGDKYKDFISLVDYVIETEYDDFVQSLIDSGRLGDDFPSLEGVEDAVDKLLFPSQQDGLDEVVEAAIRDKKDQFYGHAYARACRLLYDAPKAKRGSPR